MPVPDVTKHRRHRVDGHHEEDPDDLSLLVTVRIIRGMSVDEVQREGGRDQRAGLYNTQPRNLRLVGRCTAREKAEATHTIHIIQPSVWNVRGPATGSTSPSVWQ